MVPCRANVATEVFLYGQVRAEWHKTFSTALKTPVVGKYEQLPFLNFIDDIFDTFSKNTYNISNIYNTIAHVPGWLKKTICRSGPTLPSLPW